jgi:hypothetical protein
VKRRARDSDGRHPSLRYAFPYETSDTVFGTLATPEFLIQRIRACSWEASFKQLAWLAAKVSHYGADSEEVRRLTLDPLSNISGDASAASIVANAKLAIATRRNQMTLAHEQVLSFVQHLVLLEGGDSSDPPGDTEISLWLACAGTFLDRWQKEAGASDEAEQLIATLSHALRFNNKSDAARNLVRSSVLFAKAPRTGDLADPTKWDSFLVQAFGGPYDEVFEGGLGPLYLLSQIWGDEARNMPAPVINLERFLAETKVRKDAFMAWLEPMSADRSTLREAIRKRTRDGLPHAPTALLYQPFVKFSDNIYVAASPWAIQHQVRFGPWARLLVAAKTISPKRSPDSWFRAFGQQVEAWCRDLATEASKSTFCKSRFHMPVVPGGDDEVEDVVLIEGRSVVLFSVKSRVMEAQAAREAVSVDTTMKWYRDYFFEDKGDDYRGGAIVQLDKRITMIREGRFESQGIPCNVRILPVIVTYDSLGETDQLYRWLESECETRGFLQQPEVGPLALSRVDEFEDLMARVADGKSVVELLRRRASVDRYRRLDQVISEHNLPRRRRRLSFFEPTFRELSVKIGRRLFGKDLVALPKRGGGFTLSVTL